RSIYFALASLTWLAGPWALLSGTAVVLFVSWRREFASTSRRVILRALPEPELPDPVARNLANAPRSSDQVPSRANMPHANGEPPPAAPRSKVDQGPLAP
ncbi:MAG: DUF599 family protein, partial [Paracoccus sp. (in: a-proteobacteria)]|nr:DUF599 family protein [Paracoccus sp. (in: a-proteobacteria)]